MSGIAQLFGGLSPAGGSVPSTISPTSVLSAFPQALSLSDIFGIGLTGPEQSLVDFLGGEQDVRTRDIYSRLGLGGSTMEAQDLGGNELSRLAESANLINQNQQTALATETAASNIGAQATSALLGAQGQSISAQNQAFNQGQANLRNITGGLGSLASAAGNLFG